MQARSIIGSAIVATALTSSLAFGHQTAGPDPQDAQVKCGENVQVIGQHPNAIYLDLRDVAGFAPAPVGHDGEYLYSVWIYAESNNHPGMQTKANTPNAVIGDIDDSAVEGCTTSGHATMASDMLLF